MKLLSAMLRMLGTNIVIINNEKKKMKNIALLISLSLCFFITSAQTTLVSYDLTSNGNGVDAQYVTSRPLTAINTGTLTFSSSGAYANGWTTDTLLTDYFEITVKPEAGYALNISDVEFGERRSGTGIGEYQVIYSTDNFTSQTTIATVTVPDNTSERDGSITGLNITVSDGDSIIFRWYGYNAEAGGGTWRINNATLNIKGSVNNANTNDVDSKAEVPTTQIGAVSIPSTAQSIGAAVDVFKFKITDLGTADGKPTKVTKIKIKKNFGALLVDDWIQGFTLKDGTIPISIASIVEDGSASFFEININSGDLEIADGTSKELTLGIYLENEVVDNSAFGFYIDADDNGFNSDPLGSGFATDFGVDIYSSTITITVVATKMIFQQQPSTTTVSLVMSPSPLIAYVDADDNVDEDIVGSSYEVSVSSSGTLDGASTIVLNPVAGLVTFANIIHSAIGSGLYLTASSIHSSFSDINSSTFNITNTSIIPAVDSLYISEVSDATVTNTEFLELYNPSEFPIDLSGVTLNRMSSSGVQEYARAFTDMTGDLIIAAQGYLVISRGADRTAFETVWSSFPGTAAFLQGNDYLYFGSGTARRWSITYDDGSKAIILIDDTQSGVGGTGNSSNQLTIGNWTSYSSPANSTPGAANSNSELPIELIQFKAEAMEGEVTLHWQTASELNNDFFSLERSMDAQHFESVGHIKGAGNSNTIQHYHYTDWISEPITTLYYRLKQTDFDGSYSYSNILSVSSYNSDLNVSKCFYNTNGLNMDISSTEIENGILEVYNVNGQLWHSQELNLLKGKQQYSCHLGDLPAGIYIMRLHTNSDAIVRRFVVE